MATEPAATHARCCHVDWRLIGSAGLALISARGVTVVLVVLTARHVMTEKECGRISRRGIMAYFWDIMWIEGRRWRRIERERERRGTKRLLETERWKSLGL